MTRLTRVPLTMVDPGEGVEAGDAVVHDGVTLTTQDVPDENTDRYVGTGNYDGETGILSLQLVTKEGNHAGTLNIDGFMTNSNIGIGKPGPTGPAGKAGSPGINGVDGRPGDKGCQGPKGDRGQIGATGPIGPSGTYGALGATGPAGATGPQGEVGPPGESFAFLASEAATIEQALSGRKAQWGHIDSSATEDTFRVFFPQSFISKPNFISIEWVNQDSSNVANNVKFGTIDKGYFDLVVIPGKMQGLPSTGWDFMYHAKGV